MFKLFFHSERIIDEKNKNKELIATLQIKFGTFFIVLILFKLIAVINIFQVTNIKNNKINFI